MYDTVGKVKRKKVKVYYIGVQNFVRLPETWRTQQICWRLFVRCARDLSHFVARPSLPFVFYDELYVRESSNRQKK